MNVKTLSEEDPMRREPCFNNVSGGWHQWHFNGYTHKYGTPTSYEEWSCQLCGESRLKEVAEGLT